MTLYARRQLVILLILLGAAGLGLAVGHWRRAHPDLAERLEQLDRRSAPPPPPAAPDAGGVRPRPLSRGAPAPKLVDGSLDVNRASAVELARLPGVGPTLAARIVAARESGGPFAAIDELTRVRGLSPKKIARLRSFARTAE